MCDRLLNYSNVFNILSSNQFGFRKGYSTDLALLKVSDYIYKAFDERKYVVGVFMDLAKAFDTVNHDILIRKLNHYGFRGPVLRWLVIK